MLQPSFGKLEQIFTDRLQRHGSNARRTRCLPYFYVIGASKSGTTDFFENLIRHPNIAEPAAKEPTWWNARLGGSANARFRDYVDLFDVAAEQIWQTWKVSHIQSLTGEATPSYCYDNDGWRLIPGNRDLDEPRYGVPHVIRHVTPSAKIILLLRDPTERVYSHYRNVKPQDRPEVFHDHVIKALRLLTDCFRNRTIRGCFYDPKVNRDILPLHMRASLYAVMLHDWLTVFPRKQILVIKSERYFSDRVDVLNKAYAFLGLKKLPDDLARVITGGYIINDKRKRGVSMVPMLSETKRLLDDFLKPFNERLRLLLGDEFTWK
ncbi:hypothetical protein LSH36_1007g01035 [Paralvinella palmiformis]|uniref:Sulfotransferase domain-containing protein n=1 Tax=Paralvinella palmiformis TaxID=53620 RepID=A0AAD9IWN2_9ANNE|nr:hypothetical protein LSH36_1007g01035 [Paralvinella palmiformis]